MWDLNRAERKALGAALVLVGVSLVTRTLLVPDPGRLEGLEEIDPTTDLAATVFGGLRCSPATLLLPRMSTHGNDAAGALAPDVLDLLGATIDKVLARYGPAMADRTIGADQWLRFEGKRWTLRLRARPESVGGVAVVRSWTAAFAKGFATVPEALRALGLPSPKPPTRSGDLRQPLYDAAGCVHSLTVSLRDGRVRAVSGFDEMPDW